HQAPNRLHVSRDGRPTGDQCQSVSSHQSAVGGHQSLICAILRNPSVTAIIRRMTDETLEKLAIRELVENWIVWRDAGDWDRFRTVWHDDGRMMATWFQGTADEFIKVSQEGYERGVRILHFLGGSSVDIAGARAIAQTKMTISQRASVDGVVCDVVCTGRFYHLLENR